MAGPLTTIPDLEVRLGSTLTGADLVRAQANIADVSVLIRTAADTDWSLDTDPVVPEVARLVATQVALRAFRNPDGFAAENIGGAYSYTYGPGAQQGVFLTADETLIVQAAAGRTGANGSSAFTGTVKTTSAYDGAATTTVYVAETTPEAEPIPYIVVLA